MRFGTYEASYDNLPQMMEIIMQRNPGGPYMGAGSSHATTGPSPSFMGTGPSPSFMGAGTEDDISFSMDDLMGGDDMYGYNVLRSSQLQGGPLYPSQDVPSQTPAPPERPPRHIGPPTRFTFPTGQLLQRARRTRRRTGG